MGLPTEFSKFNLVGPKKPARRRLVMTGEGGPACGKTDFFYRTFPRPALAIQLDLNDEGIRERYVGQDLYFKDVIVPTYIGDHTEAQRAKDMVIATEVRNLYAEAAKGNYFRSIMVDEGEELWTLARRAFLTDLGFGGSSRPSYAGPNAWMKRFYTLAKQNRVNLYIPHRQKDGQDGAASSSKKEHGGWKKALYESQCHVVFAKNAEEDGLDKFTMTVMKCTANTSVEEQVFTGRDISLPNLGQTIFPLSDEEDWV